MLAEIGDGGFCAADFEVVQQLGRLAWVCLFLGTPAITCCVHGLTILVPASYAYLPQTVCHHQGICMVLLSSSREEAFVHSNWRTFIHESG